MACNVKNIFCENPYRFLYIADSHQACHVSNIIGNPIKTGITSVNGISEDRYDTIEFHPAYWSIRGVMDQSTFYSNITNSDGLIGI